MNSTLYRSIIPTAIFFVALPFCSHAEVGAVPPNNSLVISNDSRFDVALFRNGLPWEDKRMPSSLVNHWPIQIISGHTMTLTNCSDISQEKLEIRLDAMQSELRGCIVTSHVIAAHTWSVIVGTNCPCATITVTTSDFSAKPKQ